MAHSGASQASASTGRPGDLAEMQTVFEGKGGPGIQHSQGAPIPGPCDEAESPDSKGGLSKLLL